MGNQLKKVLMWCVALLIVLTLIALSGEHPLIEAAAYVLLPSLPLLAALHAMHWVKGVVYMWWLRLSLIWTIVSMLLVLVIPQLQGKALASTVVVLLFSIATIVIIFNRAFLKQYRSAMAEQG